ncbi:hypothetical protein JI435_428680 [Parastagonospora nodorum SN15]|uniref:Uncharacterized protein n=1 Tax=Phaeosphaeria nodorum (strain SN15 / ATCC MYA-4574 / FGSC 10173) TaxID=321614 RepID=A0A7U2ETN3_PHANO|nr:hypothetical protein HBH45_093020 [Parastagonospora nodorum]KAH4634878.1 hypothetical protein HBH55_066420 [Parastagonospora nodorum]KAH4645041.1 hypothetical protein HBH81_055390 [Parastagonospora nodorum]KAH6074361.1 hypothetical protein HBI67_065810 [Parastagonospora nodorum]QRC92890.1 hypothetical protein JI435_428680 [Parastagonospora nodorum SN15]
MSGPLLHHFPTPKLPAVVRPSQILHQTQTMQVTAITLAAFAAMVSAAPQLITGTTVITQTTTYFHTVTAYQGANGPVVTSTQTPTTDDYHKLYFPDISTPTPLPSNWPKTRWIW